MEQIPSIVHLQTELNNSFKKPCHLDSYLGQGDNSYIYRGINPEKKVYLIKFVKKDKNLNKNLMEIGFIRAISLFPDSSKYLNPCHDFTISPNYLIVIMDVFRGRDMATFGPILANLNEYDYTEMVKQIIKFSLESIAYIHKRGVSHQNITPHSIVISCPDNKNIKRLKFVDFGNSCGYYLDPYNKRYLTQKCDYIVKRDTAFPPEYYQKDKLVTEISNLMKNNRRDTIEIYMAKKDDIWVLGTFFWCLANREEVGHNPFHKKFPETKDPVSLFNQNDYRYFRGNQSLKKIHQYIINNILVPVHERKSANELLNKFLLLEKYGWEYV